MPTTLTLQEGRYSIELELPSTAGGLLYHAHDVTDDSPVTLVEVTVPLPKLASSTQREAAAASFLEQAKTISAFRHKSFLPVTGYFSEAGRHFVVTDGSVGDSLSSLLADGSKFISAAQVSDWMDSILDVLQGMHSFRPPLNYPFLRPWNVVLNGDGQARLLASGAFRFDMAGGAGGSAAGESDVSIAYSPIEQIWNGLDAASQKVIINTYDEASEKVLKLPHDSRSDLFSLGSMMYHLLTGRQPVDALERSIEIIDGNGDPLESPHAVNPEIPVEVSDVVMKSIELKREYRFDSAAIIRQVLKTALVRARERAGANDKVAATSSASPERKENKRSTSPSARRLPTESAAAAKSGVAEILADAEDDLLGLLSTLEDTKAPNRESDIRSFEERTAESGTSQPDVDVHAEEHGLQPAEASAIVTADPRGINASPPALTESSPIEALADDTGLSIFENETTRSGISIPAMAVAAVVLIAAVLGAWFYLGGSRSAGATASEIPPSTRPAQPEQSAVTSAPIGQNQAEVSPANTPDIPSSAPDVLSESKAEAPKTQPVPASVKTKKAAPPPAKAPAQKKAVTVDDLINDN